MTSRFGVHGFDGVAISAAPRRDLDADASARVCRDAGDALQPWLEPIGVDKAIGMLAELAVLTKRRADDDASADLTLSAYAQRLAQFPADVVEQVLHGWVSANVFWPAWAELQLAIDRRMAGRLAIKRALGP